MATDNPQNGPKVYKIKRIQIGLNVILQIIIVLFIVIMANAISYNHYKRWDWSRNHKYALAEKSKSVVANLKKPVTAYVLFFANSEIYGDVENLLKEYQYASGKKISVESVDLARSRTRALELQAKYKFGNENLVILDCGGRTKFLKATDMADYDNTGEMYGQPPVLKDFKGEQVITSALIELSEEKQNKLYLVKGQGERDINGDGYKGINLFIQHENIAIDTVDLQNVPEVPQDAKALIIVGPRYDFSDREMKLLRDYWDKKGRIFLLLDPNAQTPHLTAFLAEQGIKPDDDRLLRTFVARQLTGPVSVLTKDVTGRFIEGSPITRNFKDVNALFLGSTQSITLDHQRAQAANIRLQMLVQATEGYWGKTDYNVQEGDPMIFDSKRDHGQPLAIVISAEKGALNDPNVKVDSSRMLVAGNCDFLSDASISEANANLDFTLNSIDWLLDRQELIGIAPKVSKMFSLNLTDAQISNITLLTMCTIPSFVAVFGFMVWWRRRH